MHIEYCRHRNAGVAERLPRGAAMLAVASRKPKALLSTAHDDSAVAALVATAMIPSTGMETTSTKLAVR